MIPCSILLRFVFSHSLTCWTRHYRLQITLYIISYTSHFTCICAREIQELLVSNYGILALRVLGSTTDDRSGLVHSFRCDSVRRLDIWQTRDGPHTWSASGRSSCVRTAMLVPSCGSSARNHQAGKASTKGDGSRPSASS
ncbi:hypothetical protein IW261DRAFT_545269 [Armillaria novae-zelandiae]|uniref:Uncharacterized protein n=1 Tax=Armillaria novae-zelandiae TaxID=153914 RepID=A0AA39TZU6_9AGAR|nr:hypothetical protein IW261DRAFT_545269 [Armillaria novae-zelandiae]